MDGQAERPSERERTSQTRSRILIRGTTTKCCRRSLVCYAPGVKATPGTLQEGGASFATTHWSVVAQSALSVRQFSLVRICENEGLLGLDAIRPIRLANAIGERLHRLRPVYQRIPDELAIC